MHSLDVTFKISFEAKAQLTNVTLVLLKFFMDTFNVSSKVGLFECSIITKITFEGLHEPLQNGVLVYFSDHKSFGKLCIGVV